MYSTPLHSTYRNVTFIFIIFYSYIWNACLTSAIYFCWIYRLARDGIAIIIHTLHNIHNTCDTNAEYIFVVSLSSSSSPPRYTAHISYACIFWTLNIQIPQQKRSACIGFAVFFSVCLSLVRKRPVLAGIRFEKKMFFFWFAWFLMFFSFSLHNVITWPLVLFVVRFVWLLFLILFSFKICSIVVRYNDTYKTYTISEFYFAKWMNLNRPRVYFRLKV